MARWLDPSYSRGNMAWLERSEAEKVSVEARCFGPLVEDLSPHGLTSGCALSEGSRHEGLMSDASPPELVREQAVVDIAMGLPDQVGMLDECEAVAAAVLDECKALEALVLDAQSARLGAAREHYRAVLLGNAELRDPAFFLTTQQSLLKWLEVLTTLDEARFDLRAACAAVLLPGVEALAPVDCRGEVGCNAGEERLDEPTVVRGGASGGKPDAWSRALGRELEAWGGELGND